VRRAFAAGLTALALLAGCGGGGENGTEGIVFKDPSGSIDVARGMKFTFEFSVNASVGYDWEPAGSLPASAPVALKDTRVHYENPDSAGDSGVKRFVYDAKRTGEATIVLRKLFRGDEEERRTLHVRVRD
jgi:predicted secreted protein